MPLGRFDGYHHDCGTGDEVIAHIHEKPGIQIGSTLSQNRLAIHAGRSQTWVRLQGNAVNVRGEIWQADFYNGGRIRGYVLAAFAPPRDGRTHDDIPSPPARRAGGE